MKIAVVGATGLVGGEIMKVMEEMEFPVTTLIPVASSKSIGKSVAFRDQSWPVVDVDQALEMKPDIAIFSAGGSASKALAPRFAEIGCLVIDNSSAWRMEPGIPLIVPEVNWSHLNESRIIANPNCSTIQMVVALAPLHAAFGIKRLIISTYQSVTGTGKAAVDQLFAEREGRDYTAVYPTRIDLNCIPHCDVFLDNGYTKEEMKLVHETRKILGDPTLAITATAVRVPVIGGHSESINVEFEKPFTLEAVRELLGKTEGLQVVDDPTNAYYPTPRMAHGKNDVFVGRIRQDESNSQAINMWIVADNLRKGAATNAVQIALKYLESKKQFAH